MSPHVVAVVGADGDDLLIDDRAPDPLRVDRQQFAAAQSSYSKAKHRTITVESIDDEIDWADAISEAISAGVVGFDEPPVPQIAANVSFLGLARWQELLTDHRNPKGWSSVFGEAKVAAIGLARLVECIDHAYTAPAAGRPLYAEFLRQASIATDDASLGDVAELFERSGALWAAITTLFAAADPVLKRFCDLADQRVAQLDEVPDPDEMADLRSEQQEVVAGSRIAAADAQAIDTTIADQVAGIIDLEQQAMSELRR